jgi:hypothetical protein
MADLKEEFALKLIAATEDRIPAEMLPPEWRLRRMSDCNRKYTLSLIPVRNASGRQRWVTARIQRRIVNRRAICEELGVILTS